MAESKKAFAMMYGIAGDPMVTLVSYYIEELLSEQLITAAQSRDIRLKLNKEFSEVLQIEIARFKKTD